MRVLIVEDDATSRRVMQKFLEPHGDCDLAEDGYSALDLFRSALDQKKPYDLVCLDIMMPGMSGHDVLHEIRGLEEQMGVRGLDGAKVIMTTALADSKNVREAFKSQCEAYLVKPIDRKKLLHEMKSLGLLA